MVLTNFATESDYKSYSHSSEVPDNLLFLLDRANELVSFAITSYDKLNPLHEESAKKAVCCQVHYWAETQTSPFDIGPVSSFSLGDLSMSSSETPQRSPVSLCDMAVQYLRAAGLIYKGLTKHMRGPQIV